MRSWSKSKEEAWWTQWAKAWAWRPRCAKRFQSGEKPAENAHGAWVEELHAWNIPCQKPQWQVLLACYRTLDCPDQYVWFATHTLPARNQEVWGAMEKVENCFEPAKNNAWPATSQATLASSFCGSLSKWPTKAAPMVECLQNNLQNAENKNATDGGVVAAYLQYRKKTVHCRTLTWNFQKPMTHVTLTAGLAEPGDVKEFGLKTLHFPLRAGPKVKRYGTGTASSDSEASRKAAMRRLCKQKMLPHLPSHCWVHLLLDLMVGQLEIGNPVHCTAFVGKLGQTGQLALARNKHEVRSKSETNSGKLALPQTWNRKTATCQGQTWTNERGNSKTKWKFTSVRQGTGHDFLLKRSKVEPTQFASGQRELIIAFIPHPQRKVSAHNNCWFCAGPSAIGLPAMTKCEQATTWQSCNTATVTIVFFHHIANALHQENEIRKCAGCQKKNNTTPQDVEWADRHMLSLNHPREIQRPLASLNVEVGLSRSPRPSNWSRLGWLARTRCSPIRKLCNQRLLQVLHLAESSWAIRELLQHALWKRSPVVGPSQQAQCRLWQGIHWASLGRRCSRRIPFFVDHALQGL